MHVIELDKRRSFQKEMVEYNGKDAPLHQSHILD
jgi:hypothetical protein